MDDYKIKKILSPEEQKKLIEIVKNKDLGIGVYLSLLAGLKPREIRSLRWRNIDFQKKLLIINNRRKIDIDLEFIKRLRERKRRQKLIAKSITANMYILSIDGIEPISCKKYSNFIYKLSKDINIHHLNSLCLRNTHIFIL